MNTETVLYFPEESQFQTLLCDFLRNWEIGYANYLCRDHWARDMDMVILAGSILMFSLISSYTPRYTHMHLYLPICSPQFGYPASSLY